MRTKKDMLEFALFGEQAGICRVGLKVRNPQAVEQLPDARRFLGCLWFARYLCDHDGAWPPDWNPSAAERNKVADTIRELAAIELEDGDEHELVARTRIAQALVRYDA